MIKEEEVGRPYDLSDLRKIRTSQRNVRALRVRMSGLRPDGVPLRKLKVIEERTLRNLFDLKNDVRRIIRRIAISRYVRVLEYHYHGGLSTDEMRSVMHYSRDYLRKLRTEAVAAFEREALLAKERTKE